ncbi:MAG: RodZ domain-containing protein [Sphingomicrobium sp.]
MDEEVVEKAMPTVGQQLRAARTKKKMSLEDLAAQTRIPLRHLQSLEDSDWASLPAPTYTVGFAKSYANAVDLDRVAIGEQLRAEMGDVRMVPMAPAEVFEPADPARSMPKWLVLGAIAAVLLIVLLFRWMNNRELYGNDQGQPANQVAPAPAATVAQPPSPVAQGAVVLSALEPVWVAVYDKAGTSYFSGMLNPGTDLPVPATATAPLLKTGKPEALKIMVGATPAPAVGVPGKMVSDISLLPADLLRTGAATPPAAAPAPAAIAPAPRRAPPPAPRRAAPRPAATPPATPARAPVPVGNQVS